MFVVGLFSQATGLLALAAMLVVSGIPDVSLGTVGFAIGAGVLEFVAISCLYFSLAIGDMSRVAPIFATSTVIPVLFGLASGEHPTFGQTAGVVLAITGAVLVSIEPRQSSVGTATRSLTPVLFAFAAAAAIGILTIVLQQLSEDGALIGPFFIRLGACVLFAVAVAARTHRHEVMAMCQRTRLTLGGIGLADAAGFALFTAATIYGPLIVTAPLAGTFPAVTVVLAMALLGERLQCWQRLGVAAAVAGGSLIAAL